MTTPAGNDNIIIELLANLNIDTTQAQRKLNEMMDNVSRGVGGAVAGVGGAVGLGGAKVNAEGDVKGADERSKVRTAALSKLAQQFPGSGLMTQMATAFKGGGPIAGMAVGIGAAVGILTNIMKSSQVFQTLSGTVFKVLGFMADMFLMPFVPMMMKFVTWMLTNMPAVMRAGEKTAAFIEKLVHFFTGGVGSGLTESGKAQGGFMGGLKRAGGLALSKEGIALAGGAAMVGTGFMAPVGLAAMAYGAQGMGRKLGAGEYQQGGIVPGGPGAEVPAMLHGGEMVIPQDIAASAKGMSGRVAAWITRFQQKEMGPSGVMGKWYDQMFGNSILPDIWSNIRGLMTGIEDEARHAGTNVASDTAAMDEDNKSFWDKFKFWEYFDEPWQKIKDFFSGLGEKLKDLLPDMPDITLPEIPPMPDISLPDVDWSGLWSSLGNIKDKVSGFFSGLWDKVTGEEAQYDDGMDDMDWVGTGTSLSSRMKGWAKEVGRWFWDPTKEGGLVWGALQLYDKSGLDTVVNWVFSAGNFIKDCYNRVKDALWGFFSETVPGWAKSAADSIGETVSNVFGFFGNVGTTVGIWIRGAWNKAKNFFTTDLPDWVRDRFDDIKDAVSGVIGKAIDIKAMIGDALGSARTLIEDTIKGWGSSIINWRPFSAFGNLQSGYLYPSAVKKVVPGKGCGGPGQPRCPDIPCGQPGGPDCEPIPVPPVSSPPVVPPAGTGTGTTGTGWAGGGHMGDPGDDAEDDTGSQSQVEQQDNWGSAPGGGSMGIHASDPGSDFDTVQAGEAQAAQDEINSFDYGGSDFYDTGDEGWQFGNIGSGSRRATRRANRVMRINSGPRYNNRSTRILTVNIHSSQSVIDIVHDIDRLESMNEASFFNGVM